MLFLFEGPTFESTCNPLCSQDVLYSW